MNHTILIVDDEASIVELLTFNVEQAGFLTDTARDGFVAFEKAINDHYALIILDIMLPGMDGLEVCRKLRQHRIDTPILMLTAKSREPDKIYGLDAGADDYLSKPFSPKEVLARIRAILRRSGKRKSATLKTGGLLIIPNRFEATVEGKAITFTKKEFDLLYYLVQNRGLVMSRKHLLKEVWGYDFAGDTRIVDVHISRLREKIEPDTKMPIYIKTIRGLGYKMEENPT